LVEEPEVTHEVIADDVALPKSSWLTSPFWVLALLVASLLAAPFWIERGARQRIGRETAALSASVGAVDALVEMQGAILAGSEERLTTAASRYASLRPQDREEVSAHLDSFLAGGAGHVVTEGSPAEAASERLGLALTEKLAAERRRMAAATGRLEEFREGPLGAAHALACGLALLGIAGGVLAYLLVRRHQRLSAEWSARAGARAEELEQFASRVAHDIVSPLGAVTAGVHMLSQKLQFDSRALAVANTVRGSVDRVAAIVDELLRFAWSGGRAAPGESADLAAAIEAVREELVPAARARGVTLTFEPVPEVKVACAEAAVIVVLQNLVRNAIKHIGNGPKRIIHAGASVLAGSVRLFVRDNGPGIPPGMEEAVFEPYVRVDGTKAPGMGLGLATVKRIVESRSGSVGVMSEPEKGAIFWVELPLADAGLH
jgi:signal transduction histidine kinase